MAEAEKPETVVPAATAAAAPVVETVAAPAAEPIAAAPVTAAEPHPSEVPTLLETFDKAATDKAEADKLAADAAAKAKEPEKTAEAASEADKAAETAKAAEAAKAAEVKPVEPAVVPEPVKWDFKLPDTLKADEPRMAQFTGILDSLLTPKEGETRAQTAQKLVDLHSDAMTTYAKQVSEDQYRTFNNTRKEWVKQVMADPELGGSGHQTAMAAVARMRNMLVTEKDVPEFENFLRITGAGDHPQFMKLLHNAARFFDEPPLPPANPKPSTLNGGGPQKRGMAALYAQK